MKRTVTILSAIVTVCIIVFGLGQQQAISRSDGAPYAKTGSPSDGQTCNEGCHGNSPGTPNGAEAIELTGLPAAGYVPDSTYNLTISASGSSYDKFGFEISPQTWSGDMLGEWIAGTDSWINSTNWLTHSFAGTAGANGAQSWDFQWIAPSAGTGNVNFYYTVLFANGADLFDGDVMLQDSVALPENTSVGIIDLAEDEIQISSVFGQKMLQINTSTNEELLVSVFDLKGVQVFSKTISNHQLIDLSSYAEDGVYLVVVRGNDILKSQRIPLFD